MVFDNLVKRKWTNKNAIAFMKRECFMEELIKDIVKTAMNYRAVEEINSNVSR